MLTENKYGLLLNYVKNIPKSLLYIFVPKTEKGLAELETNLLQKQLDRPDKIKAKQLRIQHHLPIKSRRWSLRRIQIAVKILELKKRLSNGWKDSNEGGVL